MQEALAQARLGWGNTHPNPMVGAVLVHAGVVVSRGYHARAGEPHAEVMALRGVPREITSKSTLYVTLEPCSTTGRTPPCIEAILQAKIPQVLVGTTDPNPLHAGRGLQHLQNQGVIVHCGVLEDDCQELNLIFNHWITNKEPLIAGKMALTLDGKVATRTGHSRWITGEDARADVMHWRRLFPAIGVGAGTVLADDPALTSRQASQAVWCARRFIFDRSLKISEASNYKVFTDNFLRKTVVVTGPEVDPVRVACHKKRGVDVWQLPVGDGFWKSFKERLRHEGITGLYLEGGPGLMADALHAGALDYLFCYHAPVFLADERALSPWSGNECTHMSAAPRLKQVRHAILGDNSLMRGFL
jgi:diaminohydroxyphosphoribosylaminopyrimidine deaminase/5-amino-6-(5-phosphoribosylamino)uracil reductase